jgi:hypothetical protein
MGHRPGQLATCGAGASFLAMQHGIKIAAGTLPTTATFAVHLTKALIP